MRFEPRGPPSAPCRWRVLPLSMGIQTRRISPVSSPPSVARRPPGSHSFKTLARRRRSFLAMTQTVFPSLTFKDAKASIDWLERVMGAERLAVYEDDEGRVVHAELRIGTSSVMLGDQRAGSRATPPGVSVIYVVVDDADAAYARANAAGARVTEPVDQDYGSRDITITDPDGNRWTLGTYAGAARSSDTLVTRS